MSNHFHHPNELGLPHDVLKNREAAEVLRAWIVNQGLTVSLSPMAFGGPSTWGLLLVDVARHVARACEQEGHGTYTRNLDEIRELVDAEFARPTDLGKTEKVRKQ